MTHRRLSLSALAALLFLPGAVQAQTSGCGPFTDVSSTDPFCPFILQAFYSSVTQGTSPTTFSPNDTVPRNQMVTFFDRGMDLTLNRASVRTAIGQTWSPTIAAASASIDVGSPINDIVSDGTNLWIALNNGKILKVSPSDRLLEQTWSLASGGIPRKLAVFGGLIFIADNLGNLQFFNPAAQVGTASVAVPNALPASNFAALAFDGTNVWMSNAQSPGIFILSLASGQGGVITAVANVNVDGMVFDGTYMWILLANSTLVKVSPPTLPNAPTAVETLTLPTAVSECRMVFDGNNIWIPTGAGNLYVVRPTVNLAALPSSAIGVGAIPNVGTPFAASFDGQYIVIGGTTNGTVALYKATSLSFIRTINTGAQGIRGIASDGIRFTAGDFVGTKFYQF